MSGLLDILPWISSQYNMPKPNLQFLCDLLWCLLQQIMKSVFLFVSSKSRHYSWSNRILSLVHLVTIVSRLSSPPMWKEAAPARRASKPFVICHPHDNLGKLKNVSVAINFLSQTLGDDVPLTYCESQHAPLLLLAAPPSLLAIELTSPPPSKVCSTVTILKRPPSAGDTACAPESCSLPLGNAPELTNPYGIIRHPVFSSLDHKPYDQSHQNHFCSVCYYTWHYMAYMAHNGRLILLNH